MIFIEFLLVYFIGYIAGYLIGRPHEVIEGVQKTGTFLGKLLPDSRIKPGIIKRPTAKELSERKLPVHVKEGREAMKATLDDLAKAGEI